MKNSFYIRTITEWRKSTRGLGEKIHIRVFFLILNFTSKMT